MQLPAVFKSYQDRVNLCLDRLIEAQEIEPRLKKAIKHSVLLGGKRARPCLLYATGEMLGATLEQLDSAAMAVELIHAYSLVHDDLPAMDDDDLRRGQPTCHIAFDEATAVLAGDMLQSLAFKQLAESDHAAEQKVKLLTLLSQAAFAMCDGQAMDIAATNMQLTEAELNKLHSNKTGALLSASILMGAVIGDVTQDNYRALQKYAADLGLAFQIRDDVLDVIADTETLGKPQGSDAEANKSTYCRLLGTEQAQQKAQQLCADALQVIDALPYNTQSLAEFVRYVVQRNH